MNDEERRRIMGLSPEEWFMELIEELVLNRTERG